MSPCLVADVEMGASQELALFRTRGDIYKYISKWGVERMQFNKLGKKELIKNMPEAVNIYLYVYINIYDYM